MLKFRVLLLFSRRSWYLPAPRLEHLDPAHLKLISAVVTSSSANSKNLTFQAMCKPLISTTISLDAKYMERVVELKSSIALYWPIPRCVSLYVQFPPEPQCSLPPKKAIV